jgi:hypothetical protein
MNVYEHEQRMWQQLSELHRAAETRRLVASARAASPDSRRSLIADGWSGWAAS